MTRWLPMITFVTTAVSAAGIAVLLVGAGRPGPLALAVVVGWAVAALGAAIWFLTVPRTLDASPQTFQLAILGGITARLLLLAPILLVLVVVAELQPFWLTLSFMGFYVVFQTAEIIDVLRRLRERKAAGEGAVG